MAKPQKVKRYGSIYTPKWGGAPFKILRAVLVVCILGFVGWNLYTPVYDFVMALGESSIVSPPSQQDPSSQAGALPSQASSNPSQGQVVPPETQPTPVSTAKGVYAPFDIVSQPEKLDQFLKDLRGTNINTVMVDAKNSDGIVLYRSQVPMAIENQAISPSAYDAKTVANKIIAEGFTPVVKINAFKDPLAARANRQAAVSYLGSDFSWLDNSPDLGGRPWLNPYSKISRDYIKNIATELTQSGFKQVIVESVQFPSGVGLEKADFGTSASGVTRMDALASFAKELDKAVTDAGGKSSIYLQGTSILSENQLVYGGNPINIPYKSSVVEIISPNFSSNSTVGDVVLANPQSEFAQTVGAVSKFASGKLGADREMLAIISGTTKDGTVLGLAAIDEQVKALANNTAGYILYSASGKYGLK